MRMGSRSTRHDFSARRALIGASAMALTTVALAGCASGGESAAVTAEGMHVSAPSQNNGQISDSVTQGVQRQAAQDGQWSPTQTCPMQDNSYDLEVFITNWLPRPMTLTAGNLDCYDWSGDRTPPTVLNGQTLSPGQTRQFTLRVRGNTDRNWSMRVSVPASGDSPEFESAVFSVQNPTNTATTYIATTGSFRCGSVAVGATTEFFPQPEPGKDKGSTHPIQFWSNGSQVMGTVACP